LGQGLNHGQQERAKPVFSNHRDAAADAHDCEGGPKDCGGYPFS
jgi:hypothetical protein